MKKQPHKKAVQLHQAMCHLRTSLTGGDNPNKCCLSNTMPNFNLEDPPNFLTYRNTNFVQSPALFLQCPRTMSYFQENLLSLSIPGKISRFQEEFCFSRETGLVRIVTSLSLWQVYYSCMYSKQSLRD